MTDRILADINPAALTWAREVRGMPIDVAAARIGVTSQRLALFEGGSAKPTLVQLRSIGRVYRKPTAFFYQSVLPTPPEPPRDFRRITLATAELSPELRDAIVRARQRRADAVELARALAHTAEVLRLRASLNEDAETVARRIRERLDIHVSTQLGWRQPYAALRSWTDAIESRGVLVSQYSDVEVSEARGFSLGETPFPLIALNGKDAPRAKIFTLFHELCHIALGAAGLCDLHASGSDARSRIEAYCNKVAAHALVPSNTLLNQDVVLHHSGAEWDDSDLQEIATRFSVSQEVVLRRLLTLRRTTRAFYLAFRHQLQLREQSAEQPGFVPYFRKVLRDNGPAFTSLALEAYQAENITSLDLSRILGGLRLSHLDAIQIALSKNRQ